MGGGGEGGGGGGFSGNLFRVVLVSPTPWRNQ